MINPMEHSLSFFCFEFYVFERQSHLEVKREREKKEREEKVKEKEREDLLCIGLLPKCLKHSGLRQVKEKIQRLHNGILCVWQDSKSWPSSFAARMYKREAGSESQIELDPKHSDLCSACLQWWMPLTRYNTVSAHHFPFVELCFVPSHGEWWIIINLKYYSFTEMWSCRRLSR